MLENVTKTIKNKNSIAAVSSLDNGKLIEQLISLYSELYPEESAEGFIKKVKYLLQEYLPKMHENHPVMVGSQQERTFYLDQKDVFLITYGDIVKSEQYTPLNSLKIFLDSHLENIFSFIHLLPFFPYSSDDGFSVIDYREVDSNLGNWQNIKALADDYSLMFDAVINHISAKSSWFTGYLNGSEYYRDYFIEGVPEASYSCVTRPRTHPLLTEFTVDGTPKYLWTTFSDDQIDLNYKSTALLLEMIDVLLFYVSKGATAIRLDAVSYLWKEMGSTCCNLEQCHKLIQLFRAVLDIAAPWVIIITETNVPHCENIKYFGNGDNEAQMVYQFALPPLVVHSYLSGSMEKLSKWAKELKFNSNSSYFNFLSSHDGTGVVPVNDILSKDEINSLIKMVQERGGFVSYKTTNDGSKVPYELNSTFYSLICDEADGDVVNVGKFVASQSILLAMKGVPAFYYHSMFGSVNYTEGVQITGQNRTVNRKKFSLQELNSTLADSQSHSSKIFNSLKKLIEIRKMHTAFSPAAEQIIIDLHPSVLSLIRKSEQGEYILALTSASEETIELVFYEESLNHSSLHIIAGNCTYWTYENKYIITLPPYGFVWLCAEDHYA